MTISPHLTQTIHTRRRSAIDVRTVRYSGYGPSIDASRRIEKVFGWIKQAAWLSQLKPRWRSRVGAALRLHVVAYNLIRLVNLLSLRDALACKGSGEEITEGPAIQKRFDIGGQFRSSRENRLDAEAHGR